MSMKFIDGTSTEFFLLNFLNVSPINRAQAHRDDHNFFWVYQPGLYELDLGSSCLLELLILNIGHVSRCRLSTSKLLPEPDGPAITMSV